MSIYSSIYNIPLPSSRGRLSIVTRPRGYDWLDDEMRALRAGGITHIVSLLELAEASELGLQDEHVAAARQGLRFSSVPVPDRAIPEREEEFLNHAARLSQCIMDGDSIGIHCRQSVGRASLMAIMIIRSVGYDLETALKEVQSARGVAVPETPEQLAWLMRVS